MALVITFQPSRTFFSTKAVRGFTNNYIFEQGRLGKNHKGYDSRRIPVFLILLLNLGAYNLCQKLIWKKNKTATG